MTNPAPTSSATNPETPSPSPEAQEMMANKASGLNKAEKAKDEEKDSSNKAGPSKAKRSRVEPARPANPTVREPTSTASR